MSKELPSVILLWGVGGGRNTNLRVKPTQRWKIEKNQILMLFYEYLDQATLELPGYARQ